MKTYLADGITAHWEDGSIVLTVESDNPDDESCQVFLDPETLRALIEYANQGEATE
jgi:hypothetical protein